MGILEIGLIQKLRIMRLWVLILSLGVHSSEEPLEREVRGWKRPKKNKKPSKRSTYAEKIQRPESWQSTCFDFNHYRLHKVDADGKIDGDRFTVDIDGRPNPLLELDDSDNPKYP